MVVCCSLGPSDAHEQQQSAVWVSAEVQTYLPHPQPHRDGRHELRVGLLLRLRVQSPGRDSVPARQPDRQTHAHLRHELIAGQGTS